MMVENPPKTGSSLQKIYTLGEEKIKVTATPAQDKLTVKVEGSADWGKYKPEKIARKVLEDFLIEYAKVATEAAKHGKTAKLVIVAEDEKLREAFRREIEKIREKGRKKVEKELAKYDGDVKAYVEAELAKGSNAWKKALIYGAAGAALALTLEFALPAAAAPLAEGYKNIEKGLEGVNLGEISKYVDPIKNSASEISNSVSVIQNHLANSISDAQKEIGSISSAITSSLEKIPGAKEALDAVYQHAQSLNESVGELEKNVKDMIDFVSAKLSEIQDEAGKLLGVKGTIENAANSLDAKGDEMISYGNSWTRTEVQDVCAAYRADPSLVPGGKYACELLGAGQKAKSWGAYLKSTAQTLRNAAKDIETIANNITGAAGAASDYMATKSAEVYSAIDAIKGDASAVMREAEEAKGKIADVENALNKGKESAEKLGGYVEEMESRLSAVDAEAGKIGEEAGKINEYADKIDLGVAKLGDRVEAVKALAGTLGKAAAGYVAWLTAATYGGMLALPALAAWYAWRTAKAVEMARRLGVALAPGKALALGEFELQG